MRVFVLFDVLSHDSNVAGRTGETPKEITGKRKPFDVFVAVHLQRKQENECSWRRVKKSCYPSTNVQNVHSVEHARNWARMSTIEALLTHTFVRNLFSTLLPTWV